MDFVPAFRFMVVSDIHINDESLVQRERFDKALKIALSIARKNTAYDKLDAVFMVGDSANSGTRTQMEAAKKILDDNLNYSETKVVAALASHEYFSDGVAGATEKLKEIFGLEPDVHEVINGFHCISISPTEKCTYREEKVAWMAAELKKAAEDDRSKPIFVFQHPHNTDTVSGSINWGEDDLISTYMNYPQVIHFSGHSHAPINDPRSIHQKHFTCLGTGTLDYFELDEFDKIYGTRPPKKENAAQMLIVEVDAQNRVRIYPYDVLTDHYFPYVWEIDKPYDPDSFKYTDARYKTDVCPYFEPSAEIRIKNVTESSVELEFDQAKISEDYVNSYDITLKNSDGFTVKHLSIWSEYYFYDMPETLAVTVDGLDGDTQYTAEISANSFWKTKSEKPLTVSVKTN